MSAVAAMTACSDPTMTDYLSHADLFMLSVAKKIFVPSDSHPIKSFAALVSANSIDPVICPQTDFVVPAISKPGVYQSVKINSKVFRQRLALCQHSLITRVVVNKGDAPWTLPKLKEKLSLLWNLKN